MSYVVPRLRQNDPDNTAISIPLRFETSDAALAQALQQNPFVTVIVFYLDGVLRHEVADWRSLLRVLETRENLEQVSLFSSYRNTGAALLGGFLQAIRRNASIRSVGLSSSLLPAAAVSCFVGSATSVSTLSITSFGMMEQPQEGISDLVAALQSNSSIQTLRLCFTHSEIYFISLLQSLRNNTTLKTLQISTGFSRRTSDGGFFCDSTALGIHHVHCTF